jgi:hypothetical protein|tara:strand:- start:1282 stop:1542 length:261 start_codon:yes stop_codon:yes gene_type:complete
MSYLGFMSINQDITAEEAANAYLETLSDSLNDLGFEDVEIDEVEQGYSLFICGCRIATGLGNDEFEAAENLLDRVADLFYHDVPEA